MVARARGGRPLGTGVETPTEAKSTGACLACGMSPLAQSPGGSSGSFGAGPGRCVIAVSGRCECPVAQGMLPPTASANLGSIARRARCRGQTLRRQRPAAPAETPTKIHRCPGGPMGSVQDGRQGTLKTSTGARHYCPPPHLTLRFPVSLNLNIPPPTSAPRSSASAYPRAPSDRLVPPRLDARRTRFPRRIPFSLPQSMASGVR